MVKLVINEPETKKSYQMESDKNKLMSLIGKKIGDEFNGDLIGLTGYTLKITGGTDKDGFPMHPSIKGMLRKKILMSGPPCYHPKKKGERRRKTVCGDTISENISQVNCKVVKKGEKPLEEIFPKKEKPAEQKAEEKEAESQPSSPSQA